MRVSSAIGGPAVIGVFESIKAFVGYADQLVGLLAILRERGNAVIHADADAKLQRLQHFNEYDFDASAEGQGLFGIGLRQEQSEFVTTDAEGRIGSTQSFLERSRCGAQDLIAARMTVFVVDFFKPMQVEDNKAQWRAVAAAAIELLFKSLAEEAAIVEAGERIRDGVYLQSFQLVVFNDNRDTEEPRGREDIHQRGFQRDLTAEILTEFTPALKHLVPQLDALVFLQIQVGDGTNVALQELSARGYIKTFERVGK